MSVVVLPTFARPLHLHRRTHGGGALDWETTRLILLGAPDERDEVRADTVDRRGDDAAPSSRSCKCAVTSRILAASTRCTRYRHEWQCGATSYAEHVIIWRDDMMTMGGGLKKLRALTIKLFSSKAVLKRALVLRLYVMRYVEVLWEVSLLPRVEYVM